MGPSIQLNGAAFHTHVFTLFCYWGRWEKGCWRRAFVFVRWKRVLPFCSGFMQLCGNQKCLMGELAAALVFLPPTWTRIMTQCVAKFSECLWRMSRRWIDAVQPLAMGEMAVQWHREQACWQSIIAILVEFSDFIMFKKATICHDACWTTSASSTFGSFRLSHNTAVDSPPPDSSPCRTPASIRTLFTSFALFLSTGYFFNTSIERPSYSHIRNLHLNPRSLPFHSLSIYPPHPASTSKPHPQTRRDLPRMSSHSAAFGVCFLSFVMHILRILARLLNYHRVAVCIRPERYRGAAEVRGWPLGFLVGD